MRDPVKRFVEIGVSVGAVAVICAASALGQASWVNSPLVDSSGYIRDDAYPDLPAIPAADQKYAALDGVHMKRDFMMPIMDISLKSRDDGDRYWGRIAGTKYEQMTADLIESNFKKLGLIDIHTQAFPLPPQWFAIDWNVTAESAGKTLTFKSLNPAVGSEPTPPEGLEAQAVWVGTGSPADFLGRDVKGKAVLILSVLQPGNMGNSANWERAIHRAVDAGAAAVLVIWGYDDNQAVWQGLGAGIGSNGIKTPGFFMGWEDGKALRDLIGTGKPVMVKMNLKTEMRSGLKSVSAYGTLPGTTDENIIVMAHMDGYYQAALDNGSGLAVMEGLAEYYSKIPKSERRRNIVFVGTAGHHAGSPNAAYLHAHRADGMLSKTALMISPEHVSFSEFSQWNTHYSQTTELSGARWSVYGSQALMNLSLAAWREFGVGITGVMDKVASGEMSQVAHDAPSLEIIRSPEFKHTDVDVPEIVPTVGLTKIARAYAKIIDGANTLDMKQLQPVASGAPSEIQGSQ
jgi:Peptidase family M28